AQLPGPNHPRVGTRPREHPPERLAPPVPVAAHREGPRELVLRVAAGPVVRPRVPERVRARRREWRAPPSGEAPTRRAAALARLPRAGLGGRRLRWRAGGA